MSSNSVKDIKKARNALKISVKKIKVRDFEGRTFGSENEYDARGIIAGVDAIITDIGGLLRAPRRLLQFSSYSERTLLHKQLITITRYLDDEDLESTYTHIETLKPILRTYGIRFSDERLEEFVDRTNYLQKQTQQLSGLLLESKEAHDELRKITDSAQLLKEQIEDRNTALANKQSSLEVLISESVDIRDKVLANFESDKRNSSEIKQILDEVRSHSGIVDNFSRKIASRENQIEDQEEKSKEFVETLNDYSIQQEKYLTEAKNLIDSARQALEYKTAEGLSAAFIEQHKAAKNPWIMTFWIAGLMIFLLAATALGVWLTVDHSISTNLVIGRISLIPILIGGSVFCGSQYIKQKRIAEDYAYKTVLTKSLVGFSEQLASEGHKGEDYALYIRTVLAELLVDPQRKQDSYDTRKIAPTKPSS